MQWGDYWEEEIELDGPNPYTDLAEVGEFARRVLGGNDDRISWIVHDKLKSTAIMGLFWLKRVGALPRYNADGSFMTERGKYYCLARFMMKEGLSTFSQLIDRCRREHNAIICHMIEEDCPVLTATDGKDTAKVTKAIKENGTMESLIDANVRYLTGTYWLFYPTTSKTRGNSYVAVDSRKMDKINHIDESFRAEHFRGRINQVSEKLWKNLPEGGQADAAAAP